MFKINLTITLGNLLKSGRLSMANVMGMILRLSVTIGIGWWLCSEVSFSSCFGQYDWLTSILPSLNINDELRIWLEKGLHLLNYLGEKHGVNLEQVVLVDWLGGRLIGTCVEKCFRGRLELQS